MLYFDIVASLGQLPEEIKDFIFGVEDEINYEDVLDYANYITLEYIAYAFEEKSELYSIRHFIKDMGDDERMLQSRNMQYVLKHKKKRIAESGVELPPDFKFLNTDMNSVEKKVKGYRLTEMNFFENNNIHDLAIIKAIVERRIVSTKKISIPDFIDMFEQYDRFIEKLKSRAELSDKDMVFASIALFTLEWNYSIETVYYAASIMEAKGITEVDANTIILLCGCLTLESRFGGSVSTESRMVKERQFYLEYLLDNETNQYYKSIMMDIIREMIVLSVYYKMTITSTENTLYIDWFLKESDTADWASFFRYYDLFSIWEKKELSKTKIRNIRKIYDVLLKPKDKNPENRS